MSDLLEPPETEEQDEMTNGPGNGYVRWAILAPTLLVVFCMLWGGSYLLVRVHGHGDEFLSSATYQEHCKRIEEHWAAVRTWQTAHNKNYPPPWLVEAVRRNTENIEKIREKVR